MSTFGETLDDLKLIVQLYLAKRHESADDGFDHSVTTHGRGGLRTGKISELTVIAPLKQGGAERLRRILEIAKGNLGGATLVGTVHDLRFVFLDNDTKVLFCTAFDGEWDPYIEDFATKIPEMMDLLFDNIEGWPGIKSPTVKDFILRYQIPASGWYVAYPHLTVNDVLRNDAIVRGVNKAIDDAQIIRR